MRKTRAEEGEANKEGSSRSRKFTAPILSEIVLGSGKIDVSNCRSFLP